MTMVPLDLNRLKSLCEDRGMTIPDLMELAGVKRLGTKIPSEDKAKIWKILENRDLAAKLAEVKRGFPEAKVEKIR